MAKHSFPVGHPSNGRAGARTLNANAYSHFIARLLKGNATRADLHRAAGMGPVLLGKLIDQLRARGATGGRYNDVLHIESWKRDARGYATVAAFTLGPGVDAEKPIKPREHVVRDYLERRERRSNKQGAKT
jgi:hypothetical protein